MRLEDLDWKEVPEHVSVIANQAGAVNFVVNLHHQPSPPWVVEGDECDITGSVINPDEGWGNNWKLLERPSTEQSPTQDNTSAVVVWLDKLAYVMVTEPNINSIYAEDKGTMVIFTDQGDITGNQNVAEFINNRYSQLTEQANKSKREELLADIVKAKEVYESKLAELNLLEKGL